MTKAPWLVFGALALGGLVSGACGSDDDDSKGSGSPTSTSSGGQPSGGTNSGGSSSGGSSSGGSSSGGSSSGGASTTDAGGTAGAGGEAGEGGMGGAPPERPSCEDIPSRAFGEEFTVSSPDFGNCEPMPEDTTCDGKPFPESVSPEVTWTEGPEGTLSYAITFTDVTILETRDPNAMDYNQGYHWVIWDIPAETLSIPAELSSGHLPTEIAGARQFSPFNDYGFMGPCPNMPPPEDMDDPPPRNNDSYSFTVYAMPTETLEVPAGIEGWSFVRVMDEYLKDNALAAAEYRGTSNARASVILDGTFPPTFDVPCPSEGPQPENCLTGP